MGVFDNREVQARLFSWLHMTAVHAAAMEEIVRRNATDEEWREAFTRALDKLPPPDPKEPEPRVDTLLAFLGKVESIWP